MKWKSYKRPKSDKEIAYEKRKLEMAEHIKSMYGVQNKKKKKKRSKSMNDVADDKKDTAEKESIQLTEPNTDPQSEADPPNSEWNGRWPRECAICGQSLNSNNQWVLHLNGKRHHKALTSGKRPIKRERNKNKRRRLR